MTDREIFKETFSALHASEDTVTEVLKMAHAKTIYPNENRKNRHPVRTALLIAAATALLVTTAFATGFFGLKVEPRGQYGAVITADYTAAPAAASLASDAPAVSSGESSLTFDSSAVVVNGPIHSVTVTATWLPEGMVNTPGETEKWRLENDTDAGFSIMHDVLNTGKATFCKQVGFIADREELSINGHDAVYFDLVSGTGQLFVSYPELNSVLTIFVYPHTDKATAIRFAEGLEVTESIEGIPDVDYLTFIYQMAAQGKDGLAYDVIETADGYVVADSMESETVMEDGWTGQYENDAYAYRYELPKELLKTYAVGEAAPILVDYVPVSSTAAEKLVYDVTVTDVSVADDFRDLDPAYISDDMAAILENGKLPDATIEYMKAGDGVNTLNTVVASETVGLKVLSVTMDITNNTGRDMKDIGFFFRPIAIHETESGYTIPRNEGIKSYNGIEYDYVNSGRSLRMEMPYFTASGPSDRSTLDGSNYIDSLAAGETVTIQFAWFVLEDTVPDLCITASSANEAFIRQDVEMGYIDLGF